MKLSVQIAAALLVAIPLAAETAKAAEPCVGPFRQCAYAVSARCERDRDGQQRIEYWNYGSRVMAFEQCVGRIFEAAGQPNPYKTGGATRGALTLPRTELHYLNEPD